MTKEEALQKYATMMIKKIKEVDGTKWEKPWFSLKYIGNPQNLSGRHYSSINSIFLDMLSEEKGYKTPVFLTFNQAKKEKIKVLKGSISFPITYFSLTIKEKSGNKFIDYQEYKRLTEKEQQLYTINKIRKVYNVFNLDQTDFAEKHSERWLQIKESFKNPINIKTDGYINPMLDKVINNQGWICQIELKEQNEAYYTISSNKIVLPKITQFKNGKAYYYTALHEMAHSTGHASQLNRTYGKYFGDENYAREELIAELSSAVVGKDIGMYLVPRRENAQYLSTWLHELSKDPQYLMSVLSEVNKATSLIEYEIGLEKGINLDMQESSILCSNGSKELIGNINTSPSGDITGNGYKILDKSTGEVIAFNPGDINILNQPNNKLQEFLAGRKVEMTNTKGVKQLVGLSKTPLGWGVCIGKQVINATDSSAVI